MAVERRHCMCLLLGLSRFFQQSMRNACPPLLVYMQEEYNFNNAEKATLISAVAVGYFFTQVPGGALADIIGPKHVITLAISLSALSCLLVPAAATGLGLDGIWWMLALMGAVQGPLFPTSSVVLAKWTPLEERAWATSFLDTGISIGSLVVVPVASKLGQLVGWRSTYYIIGGASLGFVALWVAIASNTPEESWLLPLEQKKYLKEVVPKPKDKKSQSMPLLLLLHPSLLCLFFCHMAFNFGAYFITQWTPTYYENVLGLPPSEATLLLAAPHITNLLSKIIVIPVLDRLFTASHCSPLARRRLFSGIGFLGTTLSLAPIYMWKRWELPNAAMATTVMFSMATAWNGLQPPGFKANYLDVTAKYTGMVSGVGNTLGTVASYLGPKYVGAVLQSHDEACDSGAPASSCDQGWNTILWTVGAVSMLAATGFAALSTVDPVEGSTEQSDKKSK